MSSPLAATLKRLELPSYTAAVLGFVLSLFLFLSYTGPLALAVTAALGGLLLLGHWRKAERLDGILWVVAVLMLWIGLRSALLPDLFDYGLIDFDDRSSKGWFLALGETLCYPALILGAFAVRGRQAARLAVWLAWGIAALSLWVLADSLSGARLYQALSEWLYQPIRPDLARVKVSMPAYALVLLLWPMLLLTEAGQFLRLRFVTLVAVVLIPLVTGADAPLVALCVSAAVFFATRYGPRRFYKVLAGVVAAFILLTPPVVASGVLGRIKPLMPPSWDARIDIWQFTAARLFEKPWLGWGFNASRNFGEAIPLHPHNMPLQVGMELGYVGLVIAAAFWVVLILRIGHERPEGMDSRPYGLAVTAGFFTISCLSFGIWQEWWLGLGVLSAAVLILMQNAVRRVRR